MDPSSYKGILKLIPILRLSIIAEKIIVLHAYTKLNVAIEIHCHWRIFIVGLTKAENEGTQVPRAG
jgi:hypothetical protein